LDARTARGSEYKYYIYHHVVLIVKMKDLIPSNITNVY